QWVLAQRAGQPICAPNSTLRFNNLMAILQVLYMRIVAFSKFFRHRVSMSVQNELSRVSDWSTRSKAHRLLVTSIYKQSVKAGLKVRVEFHSDVTIIASTGNPTAPNIQEPRPETPGDLKKLI